MVFFVVTRSSGYGMLSEYCHYINLSKKIVSSYFINMWCVNKIEISAVAHYFLDRFLKGNL